MTEDKNREMEVGGDNKRMQRTVQPGAILMIH